MTALAIARMGEKKEDRFVYFILGTGHQAHQNEYIVNNGNKQMAIIANCEKRIANENGKTRPKLPYAIHISRLKCESRLWIVENEIFRHTIGLMTKTNQNNNLIGIYIFITLNV